MGRSRKKPINTTQLVAETVRIDVPIDDEESDLDKELNKMNNVAKKEEKAVSVIIRKIKLELEEAERIKEAQRDWTMVQKARIDYENKNIGKG